MKAGRHRSFDKDTALDKAMEMFWTNGFPGTSLTDLTQTMGINKPSLYSAFGNKEELFKEALNRYVSKHGAIHAQYLFADDKPLSERILNYLTSIAKMVTDASLPGGCFVCISTCDVGGNVLPPAALQAVTSINELTRSTLTDFFKAEKKAGNMKQDGTPQVMANYLLTLRFGLAVMAKNGSTLKELNNVIKYSLLNFNI